MRRGLLDRPMFDVQREHKEREWRRGEFREVGWYPEMVWFFRKKFNPREETIREFLERQKPHHVRFLQKRGWDEESINLVWTEIVASLSHKYASFSAAVEALRKLERRGRRRFKIGGEYLA